MSSAFVNLWTVACQAPLFRWTSLARMMEWVAISSCRDNQHFERHITSFPLLFKYYKSEINIFIYIIFVYHLIISGSFLGGELNDVHILKILMHFAECSLESLWESFRGLLCYVMSVMLMSSLLSANLTINKTMSYSFISFTSISLKAEEPGIKLPTSVGS